MTTTTVDSTFPHLHTHKKDHLHIIIIIIINAKYSPKRYKPLARRKIQQAPLSLCVCVCVCVYTQNCVYLLPSTVLQNRAAHQSCSIFDSRRIETTLGNDRTAMGTCWDGVALGRPSWTSVDHIFSSGPPWLSVHTHEIF